ncbi:hypothetical protein QT990_35575 [Microcoleus sp. T3_B1]|uniref:hypothetical protein n=1 Tax=Microcoleus sp. T3_B1 TaxID=3055425 RepID=UPI002FCFB9F6
MVFGVLQKSDLFAIAVPSSERSLFKEQDGKQAAGTGTSGDRGQVSIATVQ